MKITKKDTYGTIDYTAEEQEILYCPHCYRWGVDSVLEYRPGYDERDKEYWRYCRNCNRTQPKNSGMKKGQLKGPSEPVDSPFDRAEITGFGNKKPKNPRERYRKQLLDKANKEKDSEIRREILKGNIVEEGPSHD